MYLTGCQLPVGNVLREGWREGERERERGRERERERERGEREREREGERGRGRERAGQGLQLRAVPCSIARAYVRNRNVSGQAHAYTCYTHTIQKPVLKTF